VKKLENPRARERPRRLVSKVVEDSSTGGYPCATPIRSPRYRIRKNAGQKAGPDGGFICSVS
jgi:hypothetical protein